MTTNDTNEISEEQGPLNVFLTDGVSALGRATTKALVAAGHHVTAVVNTTAQANQVREDGGLPVSVDLQRSGEIKGMLKMSQANVVVNLASQVFNTLPFGAPPTNPDALMATTQALVDAAKGAGVDYVVHTSFVYLYGDTGGETVDESAHLSTDNSPLMTAGRAAETAVSEGGIAYAILRAGYVYGADSIAVTELVSTLRSGKIPSTGDRDDNFANWVYGNDLADAIALTVEKRPVDEVINVTGVNPVTPATFLEDFSDELGISLDRAFGFLARMFSVPTKANPLLGLSTRVSAEKAKSVLGWEPRYATHVEGIEAMLIDMRAQMPH